MRQKFIAGNWKMNTSVNEGLKLAKDLTKTFGNVRSFRIAIAPPFTHLSEISKVVKGSSIELAAQNMNENESGAFTGEVSATMLKDCGVKLVIIGHSERRHIFNESDETIAKKVKAVLNAGFECILCVGETKEERESEMLEKVLSRQLTSALKGLSDKEMSKVIIAYEPVWAIGTGLTATPIDAENAHKYIRSVIEKTFNKKVADDVIIQYGGSVKGENVVELLSQKDIDGALVGGASLTFDKFSSILNKF